MGNEETVALAKRVAEAYRVALQELWNTAVRIRRDQEASPEVKKEALSLLYSKISSKDVRAQFLSDLIPHRIGISFRASLTHAIMLKPVLRRYGFVVAPAGNSKIDDRAFAERLGVRVPKTIASAVSVMEIPISPNIVVKPLEGSSARGVFFIDSELAVKSFASGKTYRDLAEAVASERVSTGPNEPVWRAEQAIMGSDGRPAHDMKVWIFYGKVAYVQEVDRDPDRLTAPRHCFYREDGTIEHIDNWRHRFAGDGVPEDLIEKARRLSLASPAPFLRIDFHSGPNESFLGEITAHPGDSYAGQMLDRVDKWMGELYLDAQARLLADLLNGKTFDDYFATYSNSRRVVS